MTASNRCQSAIAFRHCQPLWSDLGAVIIDITVAYAGSPSEGFLSEEAIHCPRLAALPLSFLTVHLMASYSSTRSQGETLLVVQGRRRTSRLGKKRGVLVGLRNNKESRPESFDSSLGMTLTIASETQSYKPGKDGSVLFALLAI